MSINDNFNIKVSEALEYSNSIKKYPSSISKEKRDEIISTLTICTRLWLVQNR